MLVNTIFIVVINLILGLSPGIDNWGHLGGLLGGFAFAWYAGPHFKLDNSAIELVMADQRSIATVRQVTLLEISFVSLLVLIKFLYLIF